MPNTYENIFSEIRFIITYKIIPYIVNHAQAEANKPPPCILGKIEFELVPTLTKNCLEGLHALSCRIYLAKVY